MYTQLCRGLLRQFCEVSFFHNPGHNTYMLKIMYLDSNVSISFYPYLIECSLGGIMVIDDKYHTYYCGMIEVLMVF